RRALTGTGLSGRSTTKQQSGFKLLPHAARAGQMTLYGHVKDAFPQGWALRDALRSGPVHERPHGKPRGTARHRLERRSKRLLRRRGGTRLLTYRIATSARVTALTNNGQ